MKRFFPLVFLLLASVAQATLDKCAEEGVYYLEGACRPDLSEAVSGANVDETSMDASVTLTGLGPSLPAGDVCACAFTGETLKEYAEIINNIGCTTHKCKTNVTADGSYTFGAETGDKIDNLLSDTNYRICLAANFNRPANDVACAEPAATDPDPAPPLDSPGVDLTTTNAKYFGVGGSNSGGCGATPEGRCLTFEGLNPPLAVGTDVYAFNGTVRTATTSINLNWGGVENDPGIFGTYYLDSANGNQATAWHEGSGSGRGAKFLWQPSAKMGTGFILGAERVEIHNVHMDGVMPVTGPSTDANNPARFDRWIAGTATHHFRLFNSKLEHSVGYTCISLVNVNYSVVEFNEFYMCGNLERIKPNGNIEAGGDLLRINGGSYNLAQENKFDACGHNCISDSGNYTIARKNTIRNSWDEVYGVGAGYRLGQTTVETWNPAPWGMKVYELNHYARTGQPPPQSGNAPWFKMHGRMSIYRLSKFSNEGLTIDTGQGTNFWMCCGSQEIEFNRMYNNEMEDQQGMVAGFRNDFSPGNHVADNLIVNNIFNLPFGTDNRVVRTTLLQANRKNAGDPFDGNGMLGNCFKQANPQWDSSLITALESSTPALFAGNQVNSACTSVTSGRNLTAVTSASGSGLTFVVADSHYFSDGNTIRQGDEINIGGDVRTILLVNRSTHAITVDSSFTWANGDPVNLACNTGVAQGVPLACGTPGASW